MDTHLCIHCATLAVMSSKDVGIRIRVEKELREEFVEACRSEGRQASDVLREFMRSYSNQSHGGKQTSLFALPDRPTPKETYKQITRKP